MRVMLLLVTLILPGLSLSSAISQEPAWGKLTLSGWKKQLQDSRIAYLRSCKGLLAA